MQTDHRFRSGALLATVLALGLAACAPSSDGASGGDRIADGPDNAPANGPDGAGHAEPDLVIPLDPPANAGAAQPSLFATDDGRVLLSWFEPAQPTEGEPASTRRGRFALRFATLDGERWSEPQTIAEREDFFVNWADFPVIIEADGVQVAHWLQMNGGRGTAYDIHITRSQDGGATWSEPVVPHHDGTPTEHGFVSMVPEAEGGFSAVWLDGRDFADRGEGRSPEMSLRGTRFAADGTQSDVELLDPRICECCQTSAAWVGGNLVAVYRDRDADEVREIYSVRRAAGGWQEPVAVADDDWQIAGCPVNGPAIAGGDAGAVAWFSMPGGVPEVKVAFTRDGGATFSGPTLMHAGPTGEIDAGSARQVAGLADASSTAQPIPLGRVAIAWAGPETAAVTWIVANGSRANVVVQTVDLEGTLGARHIIASTSSSRPSGFPRLVRNGDRLVVAWTEPGATPSLRVAALPLPLH